MISRKILYSVEALTIVLITLIASTYAIYTNYNSSGNDGFTPGNDISAQNQYQIDAEAANLFGPGSGLFNNPVPPFQEWNAVTWPYRNVGFPAGFNGIQMPPGGWARWDLYGIYDPAFPDLYPEVKWGVYTLELILVTTDGGQNFGPNNPVDIDIYIDGIWQYQGTVWSRVPANQQTVHNADNETIIIDFHLNSGQSNAPTWAGQPIRVPPNNIHTIEIQNNIRSQNDLWLDEFHLSPCF